MYKWTYSIKLDHLIVRLSRMVCSHTANLEYTEVRNLLILVMTFGTNRLSSMYIHSYIYRVAADLQVIKVSAYMSSLRIDERSNPCDIRHRHMLISAMDYRTLLLRVHHLHAHSDSIKSLHSRPFCSSCFPSCSRN